MSSDVKTQVVWLPDGFGGGGHAEVCRATDYAALEAECERLRAGRQMLIGDLERRDATVEALAAELAAIKGQQPVAFYWQDIGYPEPRKHGPYFGWPSESALRNVDGGAIPVPLYTLPPASHDQEGA